ncbi:MAG TPA: NAD(P)H-binding protein [Pseudolysinimonas sp.]|nr:NAD(P)H-binding protein [Pseudolysinimonas sp.]
MTRITVLGGTGYTGANIVQKAVEAGHTVTSYSRNEPTAPVAGVTYETGSLQNAAVRQQAVANADVVIAALAPRGELADTFENVYQELALLADASGARFGVIGGFGSLRPAEGAPRFLEGDMPPEFVNEARTLGRLLEWLIASAPASLDWFFVSPAANYGSYAPGEELGHYRIGADVALFDAEGNSAISGPDFATAVVAEIGTPTQHRTQFSVAY